MQVGRTPEYQQILYDVDDPVATIALNRPQVLNAWTNEMGVELRDALGRAVDDPRVVGIVLTGAGRGFCAGADMSLLAELSDTAGGSAFEDDSVMPGEASWGADLRGVYTYLLSVPKPIVCAVNGPVVGMGMPIVLACDLRFMNADTFISTGFAQRGLIAEWGTSWLLSRLIGPAHAMDLLCSARRVGGAEAERIGLVNRSVPAGELLDAARGYVRMLARTASPTSMAVIKRQIYTELHAGLAEAQARADELMRASFARADFAEGIAAFKERREPRFARRGMGSPAV
jgi:enoyl-CoA hydratase/carnithine racemase